MSRGVRIVIILVVLAVVLGVGVFGLSSYSSYQAARPAAERALQALCDFKKADNTACARWKEGVLPDWGKTVRVEICWKMSVDSLGAVKYDTLEDCLANTGVRWAG